jgi:DNA-binding protein HU-beta
MNKGTLVEILIQKTSLNKNQATDAINVVFDSISEALSNKEKVQLIGFGNFEVRDRKARQGRNLQTGESIEIPSAKVPAFKPGKSLKAIVNG